MTTLSVTRSLSSNSNPTETQFDTMRTSLLNFFNTANVLDENNIATGGMLYYTLGAATDDEAMNFTSSDASFIYASATDKFTIKNIQGSIIWGYRSGSTINENAELRDDGNFEVHGIPNTSTGVGAQTVSLMWLLSKYRKPKLVYSDNDSVTVNVNCPTSDTTIIMMRDRLCTIVDRTCSLAVLANGHASGNTGAAVSGRESGARIANRWYFIYAVEVQYGDDADGTKAILCATTVDPSPTSHSSLNTAFGSGKWVYLGCCRNGWNDGVNTDVIVPFKYDEHSYMRFTGSKADNMPMGVILASATNTTTVYSYTMVIGNAAAATVPIVASRTIFGGARASNTFRFTYYDNADAVYVYQMSTCGQSSATSSMVACIYMEVPLFDNTILSIHSNSTSTLKYITVAGFLDHYA